MIYKSANVEMKAHAKGGFWKSVRRTLAHESLFLTEFAATNGAGTVGFTSEALGRIRALKLDPGQEIILQKDAFIASEATVDLDWKWARLKTGLFGGEGFILEKITGPGTVFIGAFGDFRDFNLASGERLDVDTGCLVAFDRSVKYDAHLVKGIKTILFGGEGLFLASMEGPGRVIVQSMNRYEVASNSTVTKTEAIEDAHIPHKLSQGLISWMVYGTLFVLLMMLQIFSGLFEEKANGLPFRGVIFTALPNDVV